MTPPVIRFCLLQASADNLEKTLLLFLVNTSQICVVNKPGSHLLSFTKIICLVGMDLNIVTTDFYFCCLVNSKRCIHAFPWQKDLLAIAISGDLTPSDFLSK